MNNDDGKQESYDVVITAGGFSTEAISPNNITEVVFGGIILRMMLPVKRIMMSVLFK